MDNPERPLGRIIILNGTSSSGKSSIASELKQILPGSFCYYASDQLAEAGFRANVATSDGRVRFFDGFHRSIASFALSGNDLIVEHIVEQQVWADDLNTILAPFDTFWVGIHCDLETLKNREIRRGDRSLGEALFHLKTHDFCRYDFEVTNEQTANTAAYAIKAAWDLR